MPLFHRKSKSSLCSKKGSISEDRSFHMRKWSSSSTLSQASSNGSHSHSKPACYDPLSLHPPLTLNTSPHIIPEYDVARYRQDEERENRFFNQNRHAEDHIQDSADYSPVKGKNCYFERPKNRSYLYDQTTQWPLKDWQAVPPGIAELDAASAPTPQGLSPPPLTHQRRNTDWMCESDVFVKRGAWKRRGIVFHLDSDDEEMQQLHFELPNDS